MSYKKIVTDGFVRDESGKWHIVPMKLPNTAISAKKSSEKKKEARKFIPIKRLTPSDLHLSTPENERKRRKLDKPFRKELFKVPQRKTADSRPSFNTRHSKGFAKTSRLSSGRSNKTETSLKLHFPPLNDGSPLLDIDETEKLLSKNKTSLKPISVITTNQSTEVVNGCTPEKKIDIEQNDTTPASNESMNEFVAMEKTLATITEEDKKMTESPLSSMCSLLKNAKINHSGGRNYKKQNENVLDEMKKLLDKSHREFCLFQKQIAAYEEQQRENLTNMTNLIKQLEDESDNNKENKTRRSSRIAAQVTFTQEKTKFVISPAISKKVDLRKSTLNKNLTKTLQSDVQSPRMRRAVDMYNNLRNDCGVLCTPKLDRTAMDLQQSSVTRSLSRRIQKQCLLLQDTPRQANC